MEMNLLSWNLNGREDALAQIPSSTNIALLQETPKSLGAARINGGPGGAIVLAQASRLIVEEIPLVDIREAAAIPELYPHSNPGTLSVALVTDPLSKSQIYVASVYVKWEKIGRWWVADSTAHRILSDLSSLITTERHKIPILMAGDWNIIFGHCGLTQYWEKRDDSVLQHILALGFELIGPTSESGIRREAPPSERDPAPESLTPTYYTSRESPSTAWRQLDFVFASKRIASSIKAKALNLPEEWGPSDHCQIAITVAI